MAAQEREFSRLVSWEVFNFMSVEHAICEFDDSNIVNIKGYNDSGKSAMLRALDVLFTNMKPTKQIDFIQDGKEYFRVVCNFSDGVSILRDKYINGQSLYEMWKDNQCIFSTKKGNALTKVTDVPQPIKDYLGIISYEDIVLNSRSCFEKQLGVQTTGSENYKLFNTVLKSEEIASASAMLNNDKNKLLADINAEESELNANKTLVMLGANLTDILINYLKECDTTIDSKETSLSKMIYIQNIYNQIQGINISPKLDKVSSDQLQLVMNIIDTLEQLRQVEITPYINGIDNNRYLLLERIKEISESIDKIPNIAQLSSVDTNRLDNILGIVNLCNTIQDCNNRVTEIDNSLVEINLELEKYMKESKELCITMVKCPKCGQIFDTEKGHID